MFLTPYETFGKGVFMTLRHFRIFIEVASTGSITQAARNLYLTQPTVSTAVRELEERNIIFRPDQPASAHYWRRATFSRLCTPFYPDVR